MDFSLADKQNPRDHTFATVSLINEKIFKEHLCSAGQRVHYIPFNGLSRWETEDKWTWRNLELQGADSDGLLQLKPFAVFFEAIRWCSRFMKRLKEHSKLNDEASFGHI